MTGLPERLVMALTLVLFGGGVLATLSVPAWPVVAVLSLMID